MSYTCAQSMECSGNVGGCTQNGDVWSCPTSILPNCQQNSGNSLYTCSSSATSSGSGNYNNNDYSPTSSGSGNYNNNGYALTSSGSGNYNDYAQETRFARNQPTISFISLVQKIRSKKTELLRVQEEIYNLENTFFNRLSTRR